MFPFRTSSNKYPADRSSGLWQRSYFNAMTQPSFTGYLWSGNLFQDSLWPHRSSPFICVVDGTVDTWLIAEKYRKPEQHQDSDDEQASPTTIAMRLAMFVFGVLPQAVKLFTMRGIPVTQTLTAVVVLASTASMVRTLGTAAPQRDLERFADRLNLEEGRSQYCKLAHVNTRYSALLSQILALGLVWSRISREVYVDLSEDATNTLQLVKNLTRGLYIVYIIQHTFFMIFRSKWWIPRFPLLIIAGFVDTPALADLLLSPEDCRRHGKQMLDTLTLMAFRVLFHVALCSYAIAYLLGVVATKLSAKLDKNRPDTDQQNHVSETSSTAAERSEQSASAVAQPMAHSPDDYCRDIEARQTPELSDQVSNTTDDASSIPHDYQTANGSLTDHQDDDTSRTSPAASAEGIREPTTEVAPAQEVQASTDNWPGFVIEWLFMNVFLWPAVFIVGGGLFWETSDDEFNDQRQDAAERGDVHQQEDGTAANHTDHGVSGQESDSQAPNLLDRVRIHSVVYAIRGGFLIGLIIWTVILSLLSLYEYSMNWILYKLGGHTKDTVWVAFGIMDFCTALVYCLAIFDGAETFVPPWASVLG